MNFSEPYDYTKMSLQWKKSFSPLAILSLLEYIRSIGLLQRKY